MDNQHLLKTKNQINDKNDDTSILDEMDNVKNDIESTKESAHSSVEDIRDQTDSSIQDDNSTESQSKIILICIR